MKSAWSQRSKHKFFLIRGAATTLQMRGWLTIVWLHHRQIFGANSTAVGPYITDIVGKQLFE